eukprot:TRINITY_DN3716_c0_g1_i1.p1 TRINITY_DN3716_c0_g1~~TRINITY_DN3716_c0_g1_i1.p1  ORF type:complete len:707 (+),score=103.69 TRINITY_DN3716_c0_g1_i1:1460-3580(+)
MPRMLAVFCILSVLYTTCSASFWDKFFNPRLSHAPKFEGEKFFNLDNITHLTNVTGEAAAFGDFNSDRYTDVFMVSENKTTVQVLLWDSDNWVFVHGPSVDVEDSLIIDGLSGVDLDHDGKLDLLVQGHYAGAEHENVVQWYQGDYQKLVYQLSLNETTLGEVTIIDYNNDLLPDLLGQTHDSQKVLKRQIWLNVNSNPGTFQAITPEDLDPTRGFAVPHSNAIIDFDGDCLADLLLTNQNINGTVDYSIYLNKGTHFELYLDNIPAPEGAGLLTFADFDSDGNVDIVFPVYVPGQDGIPAENSIRIIYNVQPKICQNIWGSDCRHSGDLCTAANFTLDLFNSGEGENVVIITREQFGNFSFFSEGDKASYIRIRTGDYNLDGFPDLVFTTYSKTESKQRTEIWKSVACEDPAPASFAAGEPSMNSFFSSPVKSTGTAVCSPNAVTQGRRTFTRVADSIMSDIYEFASPSAAAFFDFDEDGTNDLLVMGKAKNGNLQIHGAFNNLNNDAFFFKTLGLNGVCTQWCSEGPTIPDPKPFGVNLHGATMKFTWSSMNGVARAQAIAQLPQTAYDHLRTPYTLSGLGRPANYIDYLYLGVPIHYTPEDVNTPQDSRASVSASAPEDHFFQWPGLMPNSQIVAIPYPSDTPASWTLQMYITSSGSALWVIIAVFTSMIFFGSLVIFFTYVEKKEDEKEDKEKEHLFSFRAL